MAGIERRPVISGKRLVIAGILAALCVLLVLLIPDGAAAPRQLAGLTEMEIDAL